MNRLLLFLCLFTCKTAVSQTVSFIFTHEVNHLPVRPGMAYQTPLGDTFTITRFKYYLSNFSFTNASGEVVKLAPEYFLIGSDSTITMAGLPLGRYKAVSFMIGVDSIMNCTGAQTGALDPIHGMFWTWNSGYIMAKLEGTSPASQLPGHMIQFHIGGYRGAHQAQRIVKLEVPFEVIEGNTPAIHLVADAATWFTGIRVAEMPGIMSPCTAADRIADNYSHMFSIKK